LTRKALVESSEQATFGDESIIIFVKGPLSKPLANHCISVFQLW